MEIGGHRKVTAARSGNRPVDPVFAAPRYGTNDDMVERMKAGQRFAQAVSRRA